MSAVPILLGAPGLPGEPELVTALTRPGTSVSVIRRCVDAVDMLGAAAGGHARVAVIGADLPRLARDTVARLGASQLRVLGVAADGDVAGEQRLRALDVPVVTLPIDDVDAAIAMLARAVDDQRPTKWEYSGEGTTPAPLVGPGAAGCLVAVWGPAGAPGRTTTAIALADEMSRRGTPALLVDADTYGGTVSAHLGMLDEASGLVVACRQADMGALDVADLAGAARTVAGGFRVVTGIPRAERWAEVRPAALTRLWQACRETPGIAVADVGFSLESDEEFLVDARTPRRNAASLTAIAAADRIVAVGSADPIGIDRLIAGLADIGRIAGDTPVDVVVTRVRKSVLGHDPHRQVRAALARHAGVQDVTLVPDDQAAFDACLREGRTLAEIAPRSAARDAHRALARSIVAAVAPA